MDGFMQAEGCAVELGTAAEGVAQAGASKAERMRALPGAQPFRLLNEKLTWAIFGVRVMRPDDRTVSCRFYY